MANPSQYYGVVKRPLMTEKSTVLLDLHNQYTFKVDVGATKPQIRRAIETLFNVKVTAVNVISQPGKERRILGRPGRSRPWKKAIVTLAAGNSIELT
jgi:large subunit ribosomal protein L23